MASFRNGRRRCSGDLSQIVCRLQIEDILASSLGTGLPLVKRLNVVDKASARIVEDV
jgi:hypothetical protein